MAVTIALFVVFTIAIVLLSILEKKALDEAKAQKRSAPVSKRKKVAKRGKQ